MHSDSSGQTLRKLVINIGFLTSANVAGRFLSLVLHAVLARSFGPEGLGGYAIAVAFSGYFVFVADLGLSPRIVREGAAEPERISYEYSRALALKLVVSLFAFLVLFSLASYLPYDPSVRKLIVLLGSASIVRSLAFLNESTCRAVERLDLEGASSLAGSSLQVLIAVVAVVGGRPLEVVGWAALGAAICQVAFSAFLVRPFVSFRIRMVDSRELLVSALPYATTSLTVLAFAQIDIVILSVIESADFVGRYSAVSRVLLMAGTFGVLAGSAMLPTVTRIYRAASASVFDRLFNEALRCVTMTGVAGVLALVVFAKPLMQAIYGDEFVGLHLVLQGGAVYLLFKFAVSVLGIFLTAIGRQADRARSIIVGLIATVVLVLALSPPFGVAGTVGAMVGSEVVLSGCLLWCLRRRIWWPVQIRAAAVAGLAVVIPTWVHVEWIRSDTLLSAVASVVPLLSLYISFVFVSGEGARILMFLNRLRGDARSVGLSGGAGPSS